MSTRASAFLRDHEPHRAIDGNPATDWRVTGPPPAPMARGNWLEVELNQSATIPFIEVQWMGSSLYEYKVYKKPRDDFREQIVEGRSVENEPVTRIDLPPETLTRAIRIEFATDADQAPQGIAEIRIGGVPFPEGYPQAADRFAPIETARRVLYVEFERLPWWTMFNPKLPYADGGAALRLMPRDDAFDGGWVDFNIATTPGVDNWITLQVWECHDRSMTQRGDLIVMQTLDGKIGQRDRTFLPALVTEEQQTETEWHGGHKPQPGRWAWVHYKLPAEVVGERSELSLRLQGVGNVRRDEPMRSPAPPIYVITASTQPTVDAPKQPE